MIPSSPLMPPPPPYREYVSSLQCLPIISQVRSELCKHLHGKERSVDALLAAFIARGHVLLEDVPGVGKTTLAHCLAGVLGLSFNRIQFTSDTLPSDILGVTIYQGVSGAFEYIPGPIFSNIVLADEINRSPSRTQSALLEAMERSFISVDRKQHALPSPFFVIATQNPVDFDSTFPLPVAQLDRFMLRLSVGYPDKLSEVEMLAKEDLHYDSLRIERAISPEEIDQLQSAAKRVYIHTSLLEYMREVAELTRQHPDFAYGVSTRGLRLWKAIAQATALLNGRDYVSPEDLLKFAVECLAHRVRMRTEDITMNAWEEASRTLRDILERVALPHVREGRRQ